MAIYINEYTQVLVQGITGKQGSFHTAQMLAFGTRIVAGVSPGRGGQTVQGVPVYDTVAEACSRYHIDATAIFIPARAAKDAVAEAIDAGVKVIACITEHIPLHDELAIVHTAARRGAVLIGPNTFGLAASGKCKIGIPPNQIFTPGPVGVVSRSGTLTYEIMNSLKEAGLGTTTAIGLGGDRVAGRNFIEVLQEFERDPETQAVVMIGEIGGTAEEDAADYVAREMTKPVVAYIAGRSAPPGKRMGHAGAIIERGKGTFAAKVAALEKAGVAVAQLPAEVPELIRQVLSH